MIVYGDIKIHPDQIRAARAVYRDGFRTEHVLFALVRAGVPNQITRDGIPIFPAQRAATNLIIRDRKQGRIRNVGRRWIKVQE